MKAVVTPAPARRPIQHTWQVNVTIVEDGPTVQRAGHRQFV